METFDLDDEPDPDGGGAGGARARGSSRSNGSVRSGRSSRWRGSDRQREQDGSDRWDGPRGSGVDASGSGVDASGSGVGPGGGSGGSGRRLMWAAAVAAVGVLVVVLLVHGVGTTGAPPVANSPSPSALALPAPAPGPDQRQYVSVARICDVRTDHRHTMSITFEVANVSPYDVAVTSIVPVLPDGGLRLRRTTSGGSCAKPGTGPPTGQLAAGRHRWFTLAFGLPNRCPAALQVLTRIHFTALGFTQTSLNMLEIDLAAPDFTLCPKTAAGPSRPA